VIYVLDELSIRPGQLDEVRRRIHEGYAPAAADRGMTLAHCWMDPAVELLDRSTDLLVVWEVPDLAAYWASAISGRRDPAVVAFWEDLQPLLTRRRRRIMVDQPVMAEQQVMTDEHGGRS
jgi:hypothetical protein